MLNFKLIVMAASFAAISATHAQTTSPSVVKKQIFHKITAAQLAKISGTMYWDKQTKAILSPALKELLGSTWPDFDRSFHITSPLVYQKGRLTGSGHWGPNAVALELREGGFIAAAFNDGTTCTDFGPVNPGYLCEEIER